MVPRAIAPADVPDHEQVPAPVQRHRVAAPVAAGRLVVVEAEAQLPRAAVARVVGLGEVEVEARVPRA